jgi:hypothetical protein
MRVHTGKLALDMERVMESLLLEMKGQAQGQAFATGRARTGSPMA